MNALRRDLDGGIRGLAAWQAAQRVWTIESASWSVTSPWKSTSFAGSVMMRAKCQGRADQRQCPGNVHLRVTHLGAHEEMPGKAARDDDEPRQRPGCA